MTRQTVSIRDAKAHLSELTARAADGEDIVIARHGKPAARLVAARHPRKPVDRAQLERLTRSLPRQPEGAGRALRKLRDKARY